MSRLQRLMTRDQKVAITEEEARRKRAEVRRSYGNKFSNINLTRMRQKQSTSGDLASVKPTAIDDVHNNAPTETSSVLPPKDKDMSLRRIASSFDQVQDLVNGSSAALPLEDCEDDAREERAEVLICSQTMPLPESSESTLTLEDQQIDIPVEPLIEELPQPSSAKLTQIMPDPLQLESRAVERWQQLGSTVSALFRARRYIDSSETPVAQTRRIREQRELLEAFTRPFLYEAHK
ncbi:uncharacterized protein LOC108104426 [Drosophila eugracilis]|uniref:uncharacterized protein LOC108104426 n=1 Tax=Drosophila eugracilis TaxID=29029 RepID=UPI0007E7E5ED|nr:uncharacterized protein LOC108104426 [Drosophila eugracilis]